jgi:hypothetical protein
MRVELVDERDVSLELPLPVFRIAVWETASSVSVYDMTEGSLADALAFVEKNRRDAFRVDLSAKVFFAATREWATILLTSVGASAA